MTTENDYVSMQKSFYEAETPLMAVDNHKQHNSNPDYWDILLGPLSEGDWSSKKVIEFGCGCGRNIENILSKFIVKEAHGCDISENNVQYCEKYVAEKTGKGNFKFFATDGVSMKPAKSNYYDFIFSTIVLQHIPVYKIRRKILEDFYRCAKPGAIISFQMGGAGLKHFSNYYDNVYEAKSTNGGHDGHDVSVTDPENLVDDLVDIGFKDVHYVIRPSWEDIGHNEWIFINCKKPSLIKIYMNIIMNKLRSFIRSS